MAQFWGYDVGTRRKFSPGLWGNCPWDGIKSGLTDGIAFEDDFEGGPIVTAGSQAAFGKYYGFGSTGGGVADAGEGYLKPLPLQTKCRGRPADRPSARVG